MSIRSKLDTVQRLQAMADSRARESSSLRATLRRWKRRRFGRAHVLAGFFAAGMAWGMSRERESDDSRSKSRISSLLGAGALLAWKTLQVPLAIELAKPLTQDEA